MGHLERKQKTRPSFRQVWIQRNQVLDSGWDQMRLEYKGTKSGEIFEVSMKRTSSTLTVHSSSLHVQCRRKFDIVNERLPDFDPSASTGIFPAPSMRVPKRVLEGDDDRGGYVDEIADRLAEVQIPYGKPRPLKRFETA